MRTLILSTCIILLTSFCTKEANTADCGAEHDWTWIASQGMPGFQGNCYLVTNAQIRWAQDNGYFPSNSLAPNNNQCPTKAQIISYAGGNEENFNRSDEWNALGSSNCVAIGFFYPLL